MNDSRTYFKPIYLSKPVLIAALMIAGWLSLNTISGVALHYYRVGLDSAVSQTLSDFEVVIDPKKGQLVNVAQIDRTQLERQLYLSLRNLAQCKDEMMEVGSIAQLSANTYSVSPKLKEN